MEKIELRKARDFGELFNDGIAFLRINFKSLFGILVLLAGPFIILTGLLSGYLQSIQSRIISGNIFASYFNSTAGMFAGNFLGTVFIFVLIYLLTNLVTTATISLYFKFYNTSSAEELPLTKNLISPLIATTCWRLFYNLLLFVLIIAVVLIALIGVFALLFMVPVLNIIAGIGVVFGYIIILPVLLYIMGVTNYIVVRDEILITEALRKTFKYMRGSFWQTWLLMVCVGLSLMTIYGIFNLPISILTISKIFTRNFNQNAVESSHSILYFIFGALSIIGQLLVISPVFSTFCIFNFHSQEERHEGTALLNRIDELDKE